jgi:hypothetical protein
MTDGVHVFPTLDRPKHSKLLGYPIGSEALSHALGGVLQHQLITCSFFAGNPHHAENRKRLIYFMAVTYSKEARSFYHGQSADVRGVFDPRWKIMIHAVPVELRGIIKRLLLENVLEQIVRPWLVEKAVLTGKTGGAALILQYDRVNECITSESREGIAPERSA